jgi:hypothetical protein
MKPFRVEERGEHGGKVGAIFVKMPAIVTIGVQSGPGGINHEPTEEALVKKRLQPPGVLAQSDA